MYHPTWKRPLVRRANQLDVMGNGYLHFYATSCLATFARLYTFCARTYNSCLYPRHPGIPSPD
jgi:hypothetical protein